MINCVNKALIFMITLGCFFPLPVSTFQEQEQSIHPTISRSRNGEDPEPVVLFTEANKLYSEERYREAAYRYEQLILSGITNGDLYYNLGNCYFKMGMLGKAILSYKLAEFYTPRNQDLKANLSYAREMTKDKIESRPLFTFLEDFCFWYSKLNLRESLMAFLIANGTFWSLALLRLWWRNEYFNYLLFITLFLLLVLSASFALKLYHHYFSTEGVVTAKEITVRAGNGINNTALFQLHDGTEFKIIAQDNGWIKIELKDDKRGWVESKGVGKCRPHTWPLPQEFK